MNKLPVHISAGNTKMGAIPSFSLPSGASCSPSACKTCYCEGCYARKLERLRPSVRNAYAENFSLAQRNLPSLESYLAWYFDAPNAPRMFRIHVSGDFFSREYLDMWLRVIRSHPGTRFLAFTKRYDLFAAIEREVLPENFRLVLSAWPGVEMPSALLGYYPVAYMQDGRETRVPADAMPCSGNCSACAKCWDLSGGQSVVFHKH